MGQSWAQCQRTIQHEQHRCGQLRGHATGNPINVQPIQAYLFFQTGATNTDPAIDQVLQQLSALQKKYMLYLDPSELDLFIRALLKLRFKIRGRTKLLALVKELQQYNNSIERWLGIPVGHSPQDPMPSWPPPVPRMY